MPLSSTLKSLSLRDISNRLTNSRKKKKKSSSPIMPPNNSKDNKEGGTPTPSASSSASSVMQQPTPHKSGSSDGIHFVGSGKDKERIVSTTVLEKLSKDQEMKETYVSIVMPSDADSLEITISPNMVIKSIKQTSCALYKLIIGDQILNINGKVPHSSDHAIELIRHAKPKFVLVVNRPANREPVVYARSASIQLKRHPGFSYFVVNLKKYDKVHLGLGIRSYRNKITVNRTDENSLAAFAYLVGDSILDVNCERVTDVSVLQKRLIDSLVKYGTCHTVVERPESAIAIHNVRVISNFLTSQATIDPPMPSDVINIAQREIVRHRANQNKNVPKGIYRHVEPDKNYVEEKSFDITPVINDNSVEGKCPTSGAGGGGTPHKTPRRKKKHSAETKRKVNFNLKPIELPIASDVQNPMFLQKIQSNRRAANVLALTFMPRILTGLTRRASTVANNPNSNHGSQESTVTAHSNVANNSSSSSN